MRFLTLSHRPGAQPVSEATTLVRAGTPGASPAGAHGGTTEVAHYTLERPLGTGGQGEVFAAWDTQLQRPVALKRLRRVPASTVEAHLEEARHSAGLRHSAFVRIHGVVNDADGQWIVMERVFGRELSTVIRQGPIVAAQAVDLMSQAAHALAEVHRAGLAHGDIKPSNLMLQPSGDLRILDFGIAFPFATDAPADLGARALAGTIAYMAPERLQGALPGPASDIYALGAVFLELVGGRRPVPGEHHLAGPLPGSEAWELPPGLPAGVAQLIRAMGALDPLQRPADMETLAHALDDQRATLAGDAGGPPPTWMPAWLRRRASAMRVATVLLLAAALVVTDAWRPAPPPDTAPQVASDPQDMRAGVEALRRFDEDGAIERAIGHFQTVTQRAPHHAAAQAWLALAWCTLYRNGERDESLLPRAREAAAQAMALDGQLAAGYAADGWVRELQGDRDLARQRYDQALRLEPDNVYALNGTVRLLAAQHRYDEALALTASARARHPDERLYADLQGWLHFEQGDLVAAERDFRESIRMHPDAVFAYANLNATLLRQGRTDEALQVLQQGLQIRPAGRLYTNLGAALYARGDYAGAASAFRAAAEGPHGNPRFYLRWANLADALRWVPGEQAHSAASYRRALDLLRLVLARDPSPANLSRAALYEARAGLREEATSHLAALQRRPPEQPDPHLRMALAYEVLGARAQALQSLQRALVMGYPVALVASEPEFADLRQDPGFKILTPTAQEESHHVRIR